MSAHPLLHAALAALRAAPPRGLAPADIDAFAQRQAPALRALLARAWPPGADEPAFTRWLAEHHLARAALHAAWLRRDAHHAPRPDLAARLRAVEAHAAYEEALLFPFLARNLPGLAPALAHAREEHTLLPGPLRALAEALEGGRPVEASAVALLRHHFDEEEQALLPAALAAGLLGTPGGAPSPLLALGSRGLETVSTRGSPGPEAPLRVHRFTRPTRAFTRCPQGAPRQRLLPPGTRAELRTSTPLADPVQGPLLRLDFWFEGRHATAFERPSDDEAPDAP